MPLLAPAQGGKAESAVAPVSILHRAVLAASCERVNLAEFYAGGCAKAKGPFGPIASSMDIDSAYGCIPSSSSQSSTSN